VIINSATPGSKEAAEVKAYIQETYHIEPIIADCQSLDEGDIQNLLKQLLYAFPMKRMLVHFPRWLDTLENDHPVKVSLYRTLLEAAKNIRSVGQSHAAATQMLNNEFLEEANVTSIELGSGDVSYRLRFPAQLYYEILSSRTGLTIENDTDLMNTLCQLSATKKEYDKISDAMESVKATGYGIVMPSAEEMQLQPPEVIRKGSTFGIRLKAGAPSIHMMKVDIDTQISPMVGGEQQSQELIRYLTSEDTDKLWQSNIFGKSVYELIQEGLTAKLTQLPDEVRSKFRGSLTRVVNEGANGLICLIL
jgi:stage IV sporulation protein A